MTPAATLEPAIRVQGVTKSFKDLAVLRGVDFDVAPGTIFALLGSNGAGKTTLVRILATLLKADGGTASVLGHEVATAPADVRRSLSLTGQFAAVDEVLTGKENLTLVARLRHLKNPAAVADDLLARFSLTDAADRKAGTYSGGWRIMRTLGRKIIELDPARGFVAESVSAVVLYITALGFKAPVSTTHTITAAIMGVGATRRLSAVRWGVAKNIVIAWVLTIPAAGAVAALMFVLLHPLIG